MFPRVNFECTMAAPLFPSGEMRSNKDNHVHTWIIRNYKDFASMKLITSPTFSLFDDDEKRFSIDISGAAATKSVILRCQRQNTERLSCKYKISVNKDSSIMEIRMGRYTFTSDHREKEMFNFNLADLDECMAISPGPFSDAYSLTFDCQLSDTTTDEMPLSYDIGRMSLPKLQFDALFLDERFSDVALKTSCGKEIAAHRIVLAAASPVFDDMFGREDARRHDEQGQTTTRVDMVDVSHEAAVEMLRHIYRGTIESGDRELIGQVLAAADKYQLGELKQECEKRLVSNLAVDNVMEILMKADTHGAKYLKEAAINFIGRQMAALASTDEKSDMLLGKVARKESKVVIGDTKKISRFVKVPKKPLVSNNRNFF